MAVRNQPFFDFGPSWLKPGWSSQPIPTKQEPQLPLLCHNCHTYQQSSWSAFSLNCKTTVREYFKPDVPIIDKSNCLMGQLKALWISANACNTRWTHTMVDQFCETREIRALSNLFFLRTLLDGSQNMQSFPKLIHFWPTFKQSTRPCEDLSHQSNLDFKKINQWESTRWKTRHRVLETMIRANPA